MWPSPTALRTTAIVPFSLIIRNDGFSDSGQVFITLLLDRGNLSDYYFFTFSRFFSLEKSPTLYYDVSNETKDFYSILLLDGFIVRIPAIKSLSQMVFSFNVTVITPSIPLGLKVTATIDAQSDDPIVESNPTFQAQSAITEIQFFLYLTIIIGAAVGAYVFRDELRGTAGHKTEPASGIGGKTNAAGKIRAGPWKRLVRVFPCVIFALASAVLYVSYHRMQTIRAFELAIMTQQAQRPDLPIGLPYEYPTLFSDNYCSGLGCTAYPPFTAILVLLCSLILLSLAAWVVADRRSRQGR